MSSSVNIYKPLILGFISWWTFWMLVQTFLLHRLGLSWEFSVADSVVTNALLALAGIATTSSYRFYNPGRSDRLYRLLWSVTLSFLCTSGAKYILTQFYDDQIAYLDFLYKSQAVRYAFSLLITAFITVLSWLWFYIREQEEIKNKRAEAETLLRDAELTKLRQQLQPHFLFNSLNSISALAGSKPQEARKMIQQLSDFLRGTLKKDEKQLVKLSEELNHLQLYLEIEKVRFGNRLTTEIETDEQSLEMKIPPLLLQPIVENAIKFGLYDTLGEICIYINIESNSNLLEIKIKNPFDPESSVAKGTGFGLTLIQKRLLLLFGRNDLLQTDAKEDIFITSLKIPQLT